MQVAKICLILLIIALYSMGKKLSKVVNLNLLSISPGTVFLTKFDIGVQGNFTINYRKRSDVGQFSTIELMLGLLQDTEYHKFRSTPTCPQKQPLYSQAHPLSLQTDKSWGSASFKIGNQTHQHIWYLYIYNCQNEGKEHQPIGSLSLDIIMFNGNSYFGEDENFLAGYIVLIVIWGVLLIRMFLPVVNSFNEKSLTWQQILIYSGFLMLGLGYFYRLIDLFLVYNFGEDSWYLNYLYKFLKYAVEGVLVTVIASIGWGWSLTHFKQQPYYIIAGTVISLINFMAMVLETQLSQLEDVHHQYESVLGIALFVIRIVIFLVFLAGIFRCLAESVGKRRHFIKKFGYHGGAYFLAWPVAVVLVQILLPNYMHNEVVTLVEQGTHIIVCAYMCHLFAFPDTDFRKVRIKSEEEEGETMPSYRPRS